MNYRYIQKVSEPQCTTLFPLNAYKYMQLSHVVLKYFSSMDTITFQDFLLKLSLQTSIIKHNSNFPNPNSSQKGIQKIHKKMEQKLPIIAKKFWNIVRVAYYMVRKNISKPKLLSDLDMLMKRGKLAGKAAIHNLMFHHHHHHNNNSDGGSSSDGDRQIPPGEHEFSCSSTPVQQTFQLPLHLNKRTRSRSPPPPPEPSEADLFAAAMEELAASPDLRGVGPSPLVRVVDSPLPLLLSGVEEDEHVDEAAEEFIMKFYRDLERQRTMAS